MKTIFYCGLFAGLVSINAVQMRAHNENGAVRCGRGPGIQLCGAVRASILNNIAEQGGCGPL